MSNQLVVRSNKSKNLRKQHSDSSDFNREGEYFEALRQPALESRQQVERREALGRAAAAGIQTAWNKLSEFAKAVQPTSVPTRVPTRPPIVRPKRSSLPGLVNAGVNALGVAANLKHLTGPTYSDPATGQPITGILYPREDTLTGPKKILETNKGEFHWAVEQPGVRVMARRAKNALTNTRRSTMAVATRTAPMVKSTRIRNLGKPRIRAGSRGVVVSHSEYLSTVVTGVTASGFLSYSYVINPGKTASFPWLSNIASNFDKYKFSKLKFTFISNQPTTVAGRVGVGIDYDSTDPVPADRAEFFSLTYHSECAVWDSLVFTPTSIGGERFINSHTVTDSKLIDVGQLIIMVDGVVATNTNVGDILVDYEVELIDPQQAVYSSFKSTALAGATLAWADAASMVLSGPIFSTPLASSTATIGKFSLPVGKYLINVSLGDTAHGSPTAVVTLKTAYGTGYISGAGNTDVYCCNALVSITLAPPGVENMRITLGGVAMASLTKFAYFITRTSANVFVTSGGATNGGLAADVALF